MLQVRRSGGGAWRPEVGSGSFGGFGYISVQVDARVSRVDPFEIQLSECYPSSSRNWSKRERKCFRESIPDHVSSTMEVFEKKHKIKVQNRINYAVNEAQVKTVKGV